MPNLAVLDQGAAAARRRHPAAADQSHSSRQAYRVLHGTGKTTLGRRLAAELRAAYLRIDAIEAAVVRCGLAEHPAGPVGYVVAHELAAAALAVGTPVIIDAVNPVPEARTGWRAIGDGARLVVLETTLSDPEEHRRRVTARRPDLAGSAVPSWDQL